MQTTGAVSHAEPSDQHPNHRGTKKVTGSAKTPTTAMLAAAFARRDDGGVLAWDSTEARGTLGWLTERDAHDANVRDLLADIGRLTKGGAATADVSGYVHRQSVDGYDVLQSDPAVLGRAQPLSAEDFDAVHELMRSRYQVIVIDSGNDMDSPTWLRMLERADQIVVATTTRREHVESARLLLTAMHSRGDRSAELAAEATVVVSHADREERPPAEVASPFEWLARGR